MDQILLPMEAREVPERSQFPARASPQLQERAHGIGKLIAFFASFWVLFGSRCRDDASNIVVPSAIPSAANAWNKT